MEIYLLFFLILVAAVIATYVLTKKNTLSSYQEKQIHLKEDIELKTKEINYMMQKQNKFWSVITHELKNVFYSFYNSIDLLNTEFDLLSEDERKMLVENISKSYNYTLSVINDLMEWSKVNRQVQTPSFETFNLRVLVDEILLNMNDSFANKDLTVAKDLDDDVLVYADRMMIGFIIKNILGNSIKFTKKNGKININAELVNRNVLLTVEDNGVGISNENLGRLFVLDEIFSTPGTEKEKGTGLGLMICKDFIELNNGQIDLESQEGDYTKVKIIIPAENQ